MAIHLQALSIKPELTDMACLASQLAPRRQGAPCHLLKLELRGGLLCSPDVFRAFEYPTQNLVLMFEWQVFHPREISPTPLDTPSLIYLYFVYF